jgi:hypothetical protein
MRYYLKLLLLTIILGVTSKWVVPMQSDDEQSEAPQIVENIMNFVTEKADTMAQGALNYTIATANYAMETIVDVAEGAKNWLHWLELQWHVKRFWSTRTYVLFGSVWLACFFKDEIEWTITRMPKSVAKEWRAFKKMGHRRLLNRHKLVFKKILSDLGIISSDDNHCSQAVNTCALPEQDDRAIGSPKLVAD